MDPKQQGSRDKDTCKKDPDFFWKRPDTTLELDVEVFNDCYSPCPGLPKAMT